MLQHPQYHSTPLCHALNSDHSLPIGNQDYTTHELCCFPCTSFPRMDWLGHTVMFMKCENGEKGGVWVLPSCSPISSRAPPPPPLREQSSASCACSSHLHSHFSFDPCESRASWVQLSWTMTLANRKAQSCLACLPCSLSASSCCLIPSGWKLEHLARK